MYVTCSFEFYQEAKHPVWGKSGGKVLMGTISFCTCYQRFIEISHVDQDDTGSLSITVMLFISK